MSVADRLKWHLVVGILFALCVQQTEAVVVYGARSCGRWVEARKAPEGALRRETAEGWLVGYMSGLATASKVDLMKGTDPDSMFLWMDNYCRANPLKDISDGGWELSVELMKGLWR